MNSITHIALALSIGAASLTCQQTTEQPPILSVRGDIQALIDQVSSLAGQPVLHQPLPTELEGMIPHLQLYADGATRITGVDEGDTVLELHLQIGPALDLLEKQTFWGVILGVGRGMFTTEAIHRGGMTVKEAATTFKQLLLLPRQIEQLDLHLTGDLVKGIEGHLDLQPAADSWLSDLHAEIRPNAAGSPTLRDAEALLTMRIAVNREVLPLVMTPLHEFQAALNSRDPEQRAQLVDTMARVTALLDGSLSLHFDPNTGAMARLIGLSNPDDYRALVSGDNYARLLDAMYRRSSGEENPPTRVIRHAGTVLKRSVLRLDTGFTVPISDDWLPTFTGQVGNYVLTTHLDPNDEARGIKTTERLIDRILDKRVRPSPLADGNLLEAEFLLRAMVHWVCDELGIPSDHLELPYRGTVTLTRTADGFRISLQMR